jgi:hypothetical protein
MGAMSVFRCDWCGRFYTDPTPYGSACRDHIPEHNERLRRSIERHNQRLLERSQSVPAVEAVVEDSNQ